MLIPDLAVGWPRHLSGRQPWRRWLCVRPSGGRRREQLVRGPVRGGPSFCPATCRRTRASLGGGGAWLGHRRHAQQAAAARKHFTLHTAPVITQAWHMVPAAGDHLRPPPVPHAAVAHPSRAPNDDHHHVCTLRPSQVPTCTRTTPHARHACTAPSPRRSRAPPTPTPMVPGPQAFQLNAPDSGTMTVPHGGHMNRTRVVLLHQTQLVALTVPTTGRCTVVARAVPDSSEERQRPCMHVFPGRERAVGTGEARARESPELLVAPMQQQSPTDCLALASVPRPGRPLPPSRGPGARTRAACMHAPCGAYY